MNKTAIKNFAIWARNRLIADISYRAGLMGITENGIAKSLPQSTGTTEFYDIGTIEPYFINGHQVAQRGQLAEAIRRKERDTDYKTAYNYIMEEVAYTWFNRLIAVRFMEVNDYLPSHIRVLSSETGKLEPDLVTTPFDAGLSFTAQEEAALIQMKQDNKLDEAFRLLFIKQCNALNEILPALFEVTGHYTELLLNLSVIDQDGVVWHLVHDIDEADWTEQVEIIGWLYQYYIAEHKDDLINARKKYQVQDIPFVTQLFTSDWIVHFMVENSLGRLWVESHPNDSLKAGWNYYLDEAEQEPDVQAQLEEIRREYRTLNPEDIRVIDPCMGSGHILVYAFDVLMQIYESQGYTQRDAAQSILQHNLYGLDIDQRAAQLAYFSVMMKARQYDRRIFSRDIQPHVYAIVESNGLSDQWVTGSEQMLELFGCMHDANIYGSSLSVPMLDFEALRQQIAEKVDNVIQITTESATLFEQREQVLGLIDAAEILASKYEVVCTNPPYLNRSYMPDKLKSYTEKNFPDFKSDLFSVFTNVALNLCVKNGHIGLLTPYVWMFISSYEKMRQWIYANANITTLVQLEYNAFEAACVPVAAFTICKRYAYCTGEYIKLSDFKGIDVQAPKTLEAVRNRNCGYRYTAQQSNFAKIPGSPVAYWASENVLDCFKNKPSLDSVTKFLAGISTGDNTLYQRLWFEVPYANITFNAEAGKRWFPCNTGGDFRKYSLNTVTVVDWENEGYRIRHHINSKGKIGSAVRNREYFFRYGITWNKLSSTNFGVRYVPDGFISDDTARMIITEDENDLYEILAFLCSNVCKFFLKILSPTMSFTNSELQRLPYSRNGIPIFVGELVRSNIVLSKTDWDAVEISWNFQQHPLVRNRFKSRTRTNRGEWQSRVEDAYFCWENESNVRFAQMKSNEEELNRIFIDIYGLQNELTPEVADKDVTVRLADKSRDVKSLLSYAVGCMFGRYSLDVDGLAYAGGEWDADKYSSFTPDADNVIPITDEEYLEDDIISRLCQWLKVVYGEDTLEQNLDFIASALDNKGDTSREVIRNYFLKDFFKDHCQIYQKRPIYWLFDSGKQNGFKALIYLHRYNADTIGNLRVDYLHRMQRVYESETNRMQDTIDHSGNAREVALATKRKEKLQKQLKECREYDEKISHLALARIELDLDDGVKVNYEKVQTARDGKKYPVLAKI